MTTKRRTDFNEQQDSRLTVTRATVGSASADTALVSLLQSRQGTFKGWWVRRAALGCAIGLVFWSVVWGNVFDVHFRDVVALISGESESAESQSLAPLASEKLEVASEVKVKGPSEEYKAMLQKSGVGLDPARYKDVQAIAREAFPEGW